MTQPPPRDLSDSLRAVIELEQRCQLIDGYMGRLKDAIADPDSTPDALGIADAMRWHLAKSLRSIAMLEQALGVEPREQAPAKQPPAPTTTPGLLRGSTRNLSMPDLIGLLSSQGKTGTLWVKSNHETFLLEFLRGAVVHVMSDSPRPEERLGTILVARNKLSDERLEEFLGRHGPKGGRIGELMARAQLVSEDDLRDALEWQVKELFQRIFSVDQAVFCFREGDISNIELRVSFNATQLLLEAASNHDHQLRDEDREDGDVAAAEEAGDPVATEDDSSANHEDHVEAEDDTEHAHDVDAAAAPFTSATEPEPELGDETEEPVRG